VTDAVPISIVQGNVDLGNRWRSDLYGRNLELYLDLTRAALEQHRPAIVFWPEGAMNFFLADEPLYRSAIGHVLENGPAQLVTGAPRVESPDRDPRYYNSIFLLSPRGEILGTYDKQLLVPFSEYFPLRIDLLRRSFGRVREFQPGAPKPPLPTRAGLAGVLNCNEAMLPEIVSRRVQAGASFLVNPSNDTWLADHKFSEIQFDMVAVRSIEQRRYLVRASTSGPSGIVDPWGRVVVRSRPLSREVVHGSVEPLELRSVYGRVGDLFAYACTGAVAVALLAPAFAAGRGAGRRPATR